MITFSGTGCHLLKSDDRPLYFRYFRSAGETVPIVIMTHDALEGNVRQALAEIDALDIIKEKSNLIRIEDNLE